MPAPLVIPTESCLISLRKMDSPADDMEWCLAKRTEPHPLAPDQLGAPDYECFVQLALSRDKNPQDMDLAILHDRGQVGIVSIYPDLDTPDEAEIAYSLLPSARGHGYGLVAVKAAVLHASQSMGMRRLTAEITDGNHKSQRLVASIGFALTEQCAGYSVYAYEPADNLAPALRAA